MGFPSAMYSMILFMVDMSFMAFGRSGLTHTSAVDRTVSKVSSSTRPVNVTKSDSPISWDAWRTAVQLRTTTL